MKDLKNGYYIKELSAEDFIKAQGKKSEEVFSDDHSIFPFSYLTNEEKDTVKKLKKDLESNRYSLHLAIFDKSDVLVAWSYGWQENAYNYYMCNSGVLKEHRRKGLYSTLLNETKNIVKEKGFQVIYSRHNATNNAVLIPKLKAGFTISNMELCDILK